MVLTLAAGLLLPLGAQNTLLQAAGFAAVFPVSNLDSAALGPFREVLAEMMARHAPYPALLCDRHWNVRDANPTARALLAAMAPPSGELNAVRLLTDGPLAAAAVANLPEVIHEMAARIELEALEAPGDPVLGDLLDALGAAAVRHPYRPLTTERRPLVPLMLNTPNGPLSFLSAIAHFGTSEDVTVRDLRLELLFPADHATRAAMVALGKALAG